MSRQETIKDVKDQLKHHQQMRGKYYRMLHKMLQDEPLKVTDHAIVRYLERVEAIDMEAVTNLIITPTLLELYQMVGDGELPNGVDNTRCVIRNGIIVTIIN